MKRVFISEYVGLSTRLEALAMAFLISEYHGHEVCLDWTELDALHIIGTTQRSRGVLGRLDSVKLRGHADDEWLRIGAHRNVCLRTHRGPPQMLSRLYLPTARRVKLRPDLVDSIERALLPYGERPVIGVHIRRGDFRLVSPDSFDVRATEWPAVPDWWYEHAMGMLQKRHPDAAFLVACTGSLDDHPWLKKNFDVFEVPTSSPYDYKGPDHGSRRHPAADLFALGCCNVIVGTSCSTFSHYAAHMLGQPSTVLVPPAQCITRDQARIAKVSLYGRGAHDWYAACRTGRDAAPVNSDDDVPLALPPRFDWL